MLQAAPWTRGRTRLLPSRSGRRLQVTPAEGAGAGLSAHRGGRAGDPASCAPARVPPPHPHTVLFPAAGGTAVPEPRSLCSGSGHRGRERGTPEWPSKGTSLRSAGKEGADAWRGGVEAPRPEAQRPSAAGDPAPTARSMARGWVRPSPVALCARAVWTAAALLLWTPWTAGKDPACVLRASPGLPPLSLGRRAGAGAPDRGAPGKAMLRALGASLGPCPQSPGAGSNELRSRDH